MGKGIRTVEDVKRFMARLKIACETPTTFPAGEMVLRLVEHELMHSVHEPLRTDSKRLVLPNLGIVIEDLAINEEVRTSTTNEKTAKDE